LNIIHPALALLHHLVYPMPLSKISTASSQTAKQLGPDPEPDPIDGINLAARLQSATMQKEFNGLAHVFVSCLGAMAYAHPDLAPEVEKESGRWGGGDITSLQCELQLNVLPRGNH